MNRENREVHRIASFAGRQRRGQKPAAGTEPNQRPNPADRHRPVRTAKPRPSRYRQ
ncbi:hypothetical protein EIO_2444 [Ketogulonicigenium vulgare Y25]|nr:hypothetical protein EIO_2444 [Ketogulonicigenium vulgare Y25]